MLEVISLLLLITGTIFVLISAVGVVRMPDLYLRMSASTKSSTLGLGLVLLGAALYFRHDFGIASRLVAIVVFLLLTAPVAAHLMGRAAYHTGVPLWEKSIHDDLKGKYNPEDDTLDSFTDTLPKVFLEES
ncbi:MAG: monovalent cation/H(+) antiporter subunit G [Chloroflexi bacterium]|nr:MAG: monovalent cation/H(+) antiporter subunit G [Chloroflexota bacterium]